MENYFFELPIYRCSSEKYYKELDILRKKIDKSIPFIQGQENLIEEIKNSRFACQSYNFEYNETIGWIKLYVLGNELRGEYHFEVDLDDKTKNKKRFNKGIRKKQFEEFGKAFEISFNSNDSSEEIYSKLITEIKSLMKSEEPFKNRFIDTSKLEKISEFVDWKNLVLKLNPFNKIY